LIEAISSYSCSLVVRVFSLKGLLFPEKGNMVFVLELKKKTGKQKKESELKKAALIIDFNGTILGGI